jgi:division protein CdvB (Snf7/Vps24/ESCRT-III family)
MKKILIAAFIGMTLSACSDNKKQEKDLLNKVLKVHDKVMGNDDALMKNKMQLDSLLKLPAKDTAEKVNMKALDIKLRAAEEAMEIWMQKFEPDVTNKSHDEIMKYYDEQKKAIMSVDSQMNVAVTESNKYLSNRSKK